MEQPDCFKTFFWLALVFSLPQDVLKEATALPPGIPRSAGAPAADQSLMPALCELRDSPEQGELAGDIFQSFQDLCRLPEGSGEALL